MSTPLRIRLFHGAWTRNVEGHWIFQRKPSDLGYTVLVKPTQTLGELEIIVRDRYRLNDDTSLSMAYHPPQWMLGAEGTRSPPTTLTSTDDVAEMMGIRSSFPELKLCVTSGAEQVAHYQFLMNTPFSIGDSALVYFIHTLIVMLYTHVAK